MWEVGPQVPSQIIDVGDEEFFDQWVPLNINVSGQIGQEVILF